MVEARECREVRRRAGSTKREAVEQNVNKESVGSDF
jgi:hypothetical protein